jgi:hypothetical protein
MRPQLPGGWANVVLEVALSVLLLFLLQGAK